MMKVHRCKRCQGKLIRDRDEYGWYELCIQCGNIQDIDSNGEPELVPVTIAAYNPEDSNPKSKKQDCFY